jgi:hypothetical protein
MASKESIATLGAGADLREITREDAEADPQLLADPTSVDIGVIDEEGEPDVAALVPEDGAETRISHTGRLLQLAYSQLGVQENPVGSNCTKYNKYFGEPCEAWCALFVSWTVDKCGNGDRRLPWGWPAAVRNITKWGRGHHVLHDHPKRGDIFTYRNGGHTGFVLSVNGTKFHTVEGNCGSSVMTRRRDAADDLYYFIMAP